MCLCNWPKRPVACYILAGAFQSIATAGHVGTIDVFAYGDGVEAQIQRWRDCLFYCQQCRTAGRQRTYEVIRLLPTDGDDCQYRIKSSTEAFERVAKESQLDIS